MQSILALVGAVSLQAGAAQDPEKLAQRRQARMEAIFGTELEKRLKEQRAISAVAQKSVEAQNLNSILQAAECKPMRVRYFVPRKFRPDLNDPWPCVRFKPGDTVTLEPSLSGRVNRERLQWAIHPKLPTRLGLEFDRSTGIIRGRIPDEAEQTMLTPLDWLLRPTAGPPSSYVGGGSPIGGRGGYPPDRPVLVPRLPDEIGTPHAGTTSSNNVTLPRTTFTITCRNTAGTARTRVTFQVSSEPRVPADEVLLSAAGQTSATTTASEDPDDPAEDLHPIYGGVSPTVKTSGGAVAAMNLCRFP